MALSIPILTLYIEPYKPGVPPPSDNIPNSTVMCHDNHVLNKKCE